MSVNLILFLKSGVQQINKKTFVSRISVEEKEYIENSIGEYQKIIVMPKYTPWFQILTSITVWAVCMGQLGQLWTMNEMNALFPTYLNQILGILE